MRGISRMASPLAAVKKRSPARSAIRCAWRELRAEAGFRRCEQSRMSANFAAAVFGFVALVAVDFVFLLPFLLRLAFFTLIGGLVAAVLCLIGLVLVTSAGFFGLHSFARTMIGLSLAAASALTT